MPPADLELSAFVAIVGPNMVDRGRLASYLRGVMAGADETRERRLLAVAGLAGLGDPVLPEIQRLAADPGLTVRERLYVGIAAAAAGDLATARAVAAALIAAGGEQVGTVARLRAGSSAADTTTATALMAVLAAMIGDDRAPAFWEYVAANPDPDQLQSLRELAYVSASLERLGHHPASFAWSVDGKRQVVDLADGHAFQLSLTSSQLATLSIERVERLDRRPRRLARERRSDGLPARSRRHDRADGPPVDLDRRFRSRHGRPRCHVRAAGRGRLP